jgi:hypothetical protein
MRPSYIIKLAVETINPQLYLHKNKWGIEINIYEKKLCVKLVIYKVGTDKLKVNDG